ncbi:MAG: alpha/beta hydrolase fold domain-containing protein [Dactylosporangium sp.]|nr:cellulose binding domain-containing protein [Dactylosporangium sp.]NNJ63514.1 alpha/beta hydrolase fold domain-containing protein [Dactylosporangium sp.]
MPRPPSEPAPSPTSGVPAPHHRLRHPARGPRGLPLAGAAVGLLLLGSAVAARSALAADNPYQRGPAPTAASISADTGPFATATTVAEGTGFGGATIYYPTDTSQGTFGAIGMLPGWTAPWSAYAWLGPRLASQGFVVIGVDTNDPNDYPAARATQVLAALDHLTESSAVRDRVDPDRLAVAGHSMGGGGSLEAALSRPSLKAVYGIEPYDDITSDFSNLTVPTFIQAGQDDTLVTPSYLESLYATLPSTSEHAYLEIAGADHMFVGSPNVILARTLISWMKIFVDDDTRYTQFLCPLSDDSGVSQYRNTCPLTPGGSTGSPTATAPSPPASSSNPPGTPSSPAPTDGTCRVTYTTNAWDSGLTASVTIANTGTTASTGWSLAFTLPDGQTITSGWNATYSPSSGQVTATGVSHNATIPAGESINIGFQATHTGDTGAPTTFALNGQTCTIT